MSARSWLRPARFVVAALLLAWLFSRFPLGHVGAVLAGASPGPLLVGAAAAIGAHLLASLRLSLIAGHHGFELSFGEACGVNFAAAFYGLTVPGGNLAGGAVRIYRLAEGSRAVAAVAGVFADRVHATFGMLLFGLAFWAADPRAEPPVLGLALAGLTAALPVLYLLVRRGSPIAARLPAKWNRALGREAEVPAGATVRLVGITLAAQLLGLVAVASAAAAIGLPLPILTLGWIRTAVMVVVMLPVSISGFGVREGALVALLAQYGVPGEHAVAFSLLIFAVTTLVNGAVGGVVEASRLGRRVVAES